MALLYAIQLIIAPVPNQFVETHASSLSKPSTSFASLMNKVTSPVVLSASTEATHVTKPITSPYTIAVIGDSMVDTLGPDIPTLQKALKKEFPLASFRIKNYGVGASNIEYGIMRVSNGYTYKDQLIPPLAATKADIVIVESFAYNPFPYQEGSLERHWDSLSKMVDVVSKRLPKAHVIIATTVAPDTTKFGDGVAHLAFDEVTKQFKTYEIKMYLENTIKFARFKGLPLADAYSPSLDTSGNGNPIYISLLDHIHPSEKGAELFAEQIVEAILTYKLLE